VCNSRSPRPPLADRTPRPPAPPLPPRPPAGISNASGLLRRPFPGTRFGKFPPLNGTQQRALATLLQPVGDYGSGGGGAGGGGGGGGGGRAFFGFAGGVGLLGGGGGPRVDGCQVEAIVCDTDGNVIEVNHGLADLALGGTGELRRGGAARGAGQQRGSLPPPPPPPQRQQQRGLRLDGRSLALLPLLRAVELNACALRGTVPPQLADGSLPQLTSVSLFDNQLTGTLPRALAGLGNLRTLVVAGNTLTGRVPAFGAGDNDDGGGGGGGSDSGGGGGVLEHLDLSFNAFDGPVPDSLTSLGFLRDLRLNDNRACSRVVVSAGARACAQT
jgi:hypothetical protein